jgi:hypothetical protein
MSHLSTYARVIYASRWVMAENVIGSALLADILAASTRNNLMDGVTGLLLYRHGWFLQAIEGDLDGVDRAFDRIRKDRRHYDIRVVSDEAVFERAFADWTMCASDIHDIPASIIAGLGLAGTFDPGRLDPDKALALLLAAGESRRASEAAGVRAA